MTRKIRIAVGEPLAMHSGPWTIWTRGDDLYAASANASGTAKLSVHASGVCRYGFTQESGIAMGDRDPDPRVVDRWRIEAVGETDWALCFSLLVPTVYLPRRFSDQSLKPAQRASIRWIAAAPLMQAKLVSLFRAKSADLDIADLITGDYVVLEKLSLASGAVIWVVAYEQVLSPKEFAEWQTTVSEFRATMSGDRPVEGQMFASMLSPASKHTHPVIREVALGWDNFVHEDDQPGSAPG